MQSITSLSLIVASLFFTFLSNAQYQSLQFKKLTSNEGLTQGIVESIFTDSKGFVWITGLEGINRFDGLKCLANKQIAPGLESASNTKGIIEDHDGNIIFGYVGGIIKYSYKLNRFEVIPLPLPDEIKNNGKQHAFIPICADKKQNIIIGFRDNLDFIYNYQTKKVKPLLPKVQEQNNLLITNGVIRTLEKHLYRVEQTKDSLLCYKFAGLDKKELWQLISGISHKGSIYNSFSMMDDSSITFASSSEIVKYHLYSGTIKKKPLPEINVQGISVDNNKNIWIGSINQGLFVLDGLSLETMAHFKYEPGNKNGPSAVQLIPSCDVAGNVWISAWGRGVDYCNLADIKFRSDYTDEQIKYYGTTNFIRDIENDEEAGLYCSLHGGGIVQLNKDLSFHKQLSGIYQKLVSPDIFLKGHFLYAGTDVFDSFRLIKYDLHKQVSKQIAHTPVVKYGANKVYQFSAMADGHLLAATYGGLWKVNTSNDQFENLPGITNENETITFSYEDRLRNIYKGKISGGLDVYKKNANGYEKIFSLTQKITIKHCYEANDSSLWIGATNGLYLFNPIRRSIKKHFTTANGLVNNVVYALMPDEQGNLWFSTNKGLSYLYVAKDSFVHFYQSDGLQSSEFNTHAVVKTKDGRIIFAGVNGLTTVNPAMLKRKPIMPRLQITGIKTDSSINPFQFDESNPLKLEAGSNAIEFELTAIDFISPSMCKIKYRLNGYDSNWVISPNLGIARFVKLPAGSYMFEAIASDATGNWDTNVKRIPVFIAAYWWQQSWFKLTVLALVILTIIFAIRIYIRSRINKEKAILEKHFAIQKERERITTDLHDDIGATLSSMNIYSDIASTVWESKPQESRKMIEKITGTTKDLMGRMGDIIWSMQPADEGKYTLEAKLKNYCSELLSPKNILCDFVIDEKLTASISNPEARKNILLIVKEAINNIAKYSGATNAVISLQKEQEEIILSITDNGKGYEAGSIKFGNGLQNMLQRSKSLGGICDVIAVYGKGVSITCKFPIAIISH